MLAVVVIGIILRIFFAWQHPFTNDEGAYLLDAKLLTAGKIPGGDVLVKAPVPALLFSGSVWLSGGSLFASRVVSILASLLTLIPLVWIAYYINGKKTAVIAVWLWMLVVPISMQVLGITEIIASFFALAFLALWWLGVVFQKHLKRPWMAVGIAGMFLMLAFASRKTSLVILAPALYLWLLAPKTRWERIAIPLFVGMLAVLLPWLFIVFHFYGPVGVGEAIGMGYSHIWYEKAPGIAGQTGVGWAAAVLGRVGSGLAIATGLGFGWAVIQLRQKQPTPILPLVWLLALVGSYAGWPVFLPEYLVDFFIPSILLAALALTAMQKHWPKWGVFAIAVILVASSASIWSAYAKPWTGMFTKEAAREAAAALQKQVPSHEPVFTAAVLIPYLSGHEVMFNITHPLWYRYHFINSSTKTTFLPPLSEVEQAFQAGEIQWVLNDHLTDYSYLRSPADLLSTLHSDFQIKADIPNNTGFRANTLTLWRRKSM